MARAIHIMDHMQGGIIRMRREVDNRNKDCEFKGHYAGRDLNITNIIMLQDSEREFVVTYNANIKPVYYFTGRETELKKLCQWIEEGRKSVLVSGMGGIGKTQICRKLFDKYKTTKDKGENQPFSHIGYIEYNGDMGSSLISCLRYKEQDNPELNQEAAWKELQHLASDGKLLLFVDNVDKSMREDEGLQRLNSIPGAIVLTSRQASFSDEFEPYRIGFLDMEQCKEIYEKIRFRGSERKIKPEEIQDLEYVIENLVGRHTITVELLAHLARTKLWTVKRLRGELEKKGFRLTFHKDGEFVNIQESYEVLYDLSMLTGAEQNILEAFSVFPYIPLAAETCNEWLLADAGVDEDADILMGLYQKGWLQFDIEQGGYALHPVFAKFIYERCKPKSEGHLGLMEGCLKCLKIPESGSAMECQTFIPFAENIVEKISMKSEIERVPLMDEVACLLRYMGEYTRAEVLYKKNLQIEKKLCGEEHRLTAAGYNNLALLHKRQGKYKEAEELYKKALQIRENVLGEEHLETAISYNNLAEVYESQGKYLEAEELIKKALLIKEKILGEEHVSTATSYNNFAGMYMLQGKYQEAEGLHRKALLIREKVLGEEHPHTAASYNNLAGVYDEQGEYKKAEELYNKALLIREKVLGKEHPSTATSYNNLAGVYYRQGEYKKALAYSLKAYKNLLFKLGLSHPHIQIVYKNMQVAYSNWNPEGNFEQWLEENMKE